MTIVRIQRRWRALVTVVLGISAVRLAVLLTCRVYYGMTGHHSQSASRVMSSVTTDQSLLRGGQKQLDVDLAAVDLHVDYPIYVPLLPRFVNVDDRRTFISDGENRVYFDVPPAAASQLAGRVRVISNGVIRRGHECSWKTSDEEFSRLGDDRGSTNYVSKTLCPLLVPDGHAFQHFVDGVLPKLVQLLTQAPRLAAAVDKFILYRPRDAIIYELLERVGVTRQRLMLVTPDSWQSLEVLEVWRLVDTCVTPSVHPRLWRRASQLLQACYNRSNLGVHQRTGRCLYNESEQNTPTSDLAGQIGALTEKNGVIQYHVGSKIANASAANGSLIVLLSRRWTRNGGRRLLNENAVLEYLVGRFGLQRVVRFGNERVDLTTASRLFSRAAAVVGVHGGAFYNIILAPRSCVVVELMPLVVRHGHVAAPPRRLAHTVVWRMADALGHTYWRLYATTTSPRSDVTLPIDKLRSAITEIM